MPVCSLLVTSDQTALTSARATLDDQQATLARMSKSLTPELGNDETIGDREIRLRKGAEFSTKRE